MTTTTLKRVLIQYRENRTSQWEDGDDRFTSVIAAKAYVRSLILSGIGDAELRILERTITVQDVIVEEYLSDE